MTTNYTSTVDITTPSVTLTDFTCVVPASLGVNVYGGATEADINTFDIGPTGDSNILLQTLASGGHHVHDGVCHDSAHGTVPPYGVHGIYDKAAGTLVENMEFYNHPNGQGYSPRYANSCYQSLFHDTPYSIGLFNYQGAAVGAGGSLRIRECIFYNVPGGGYVFYSDGLWLASDGTLLGNSLISVELDHCTIDVRGVTEPFDFSQCHNDVYLTNCVIISDSGLPLSSIITPPTDGSTVHLDGSIVLDSADAATYLGPAPTFTPIAVGGSPVIGTAVASPPGSFAEWGNVGDLGATQTGSTPPGPPPLPGPAIPAIASLGVIGYAFGDGSSSITIPITVSVPRSDPSLGASVVLVQCFDLDTFGNPFLTASDDAPTDSFYGTHLYTDGTNPWQDGFTDIASDPNLFRGLCLNPLTAGIDSITIECSSPRTYSLAIAVAYTGVQVNNQSTPAYQVPDLPAGDWFDKGFILDPVGLVGSNPFSTSNPTAHVYNWFFDNSDGSVVIFGAPGIPTAPGSWTIQEGDISPIFIESGLNTTTDSGSFTPADTGWTLLQAFDNLPYAGGFDAPSISIEVWEKTLSAPEVNDPVGGTWSTANDYFGGGALSGHPLVAGLGPIWLVVPPTGGFPVFNNHIRLSE